MPSQSGKKLRVAVLYGGRSSEHEISLQSAASVIRNLDREKFEILPIGIDRGGKWHLNDLSLLKDGKSIDVSQGSQEVILPPLVSQNDQAPLVDSKGNPSSGFDVIFPVMHGPLYEDGALQGLLELTGLPYVGTGVLGSAVGMDKDFSKRLAQFAGIPVAPFLCVSSNEWARGRKELESRVLRDLKLPVFVKPCNMGSSVGVRKVSKESDLAPAIEDAFRYDLKVLVEKSIEGRELELSVLESLEETAPPLASVVGEIIPTHEFYSYEAKYLDENGAQLEIPAKLKPEIAKQAQEIAVRTFQALECSGMARVDLFLEEQTDKLYLNEVNTIPGFTEISMYPKLLEASGISYQQLLIKLVELAIARHEKRRGLKRDHGK